MEGNLHFKGSSHILGSEEYSYWQAQEAKIILI